MYTKVFRLKSKRTMLGFSLFSWSYPKTKVYERTDWHKSTKNEPGTFETGGQLGRHFAVVQPLYFPFPWNSEIYNVYVCVWRT